MTSNLDNRKARIAASLGEIKADLVLKNGSYLNIFTNTIEKADIAIANGYVVGFGKYQGETERDISGKVVVPGFIDGHVHLESSIVTPLQYCKAVIPHGTTAVVADPHEIANVCGTAGIDYIIEATKKLPLDVYVMMSSCVPASPFDETGYPITHEDVDNYMKHNRVLGLAEMMNYPGVIYRDNEVLSKIETAMMYNKVIDGHAPGLSGKELNAYATAGVYSDHECTTANEAKEKISRGQWIMVREGTASKNLDALLEVCHEPYCNRVMFVTDDKHPGDLAREGHIDYIIRRAIKAGVEPKMAYRMASYNAAQYFRLLYKGAVAPGYMADLVILDDMEAVKINSVYKAGKLLINNDANYNPVDSNVKKADRNWHIHWDEYALDNKALDSRICDTVRIGEVSAEDFVINKEKEKVIGLVPGEIITLDKGEATRVDVSKDILKLAVIERHHFTGHIGKCYVTGYGLKSGAVATTIAHDSHNIIVVGTNDQDMALAVMRLKEIKGGMVVANDGQIVADLPLPIAGLMCNQDVEEAQAGLDKVKAEARRLGVYDNIDPFMTLSFASLAVIPSLRLTTLGVVDINKFELL